MEAYDVLLFHSISIGMIIIATIVVPLGLLHVHRLIKRV